MSQLICSYEGGNRFQVADDGSRMLVLVLFKIPDDENGELFYAFNFGT